MGSIPWTSPISCEQTSESGVIGPGPFSKSCDMDAGKCAGLQLWLEMCWR